MIFGCLRSVRVRPIAWLLLAGCLVGGPFAGCAQREKPTGDPFVSEVKPPRKPISLFGWLAPLGRIFPKKERPPAAVPPQWSGTVRMVNTAEKFVLVESNGTLPLLPGENYLSVADGRETATLLMTSLRNPPFQIADLVSGTPAAGEKIYLPRGSAPANPQPPPPEPSPTPPTTSPSPTPPPGPVVRVRSSIPPPDSSPAPKRRSAPPPQRQR